MCKNLWPDIKQENEDSPKGILLKQVEYLNQQMDEKGRIGFDRRHQL